MNSASFRAGKAMRSLSEVTKFIDILHTVIKLFETINISGTVFQFVKGVLYSSRSLLNLFKDLQSGYGVQFIITNRLNEDVF